MYAEIVFPLPFRKAFTYLIPEEFEPYALKGVRAVAPFGKRTLTGFIINTSRETSVTEKIKPIIDILDDKPIINDKELKFYEWLSDYYLSSLGEALRLAVPYGSDIESKRKILIDSEFCRKLFDEEKDKKSTRAKILKELINRTEINQNYLRKIIGKKNIYSQLQTLKRKGAITIVDDVEARR
ncbi:primosomal protein N' [bacterium BMS3Abin03]|nr:primosomal protein N' [bacterium BMS3Abin03]